MIERKELKKIHGKKRLLLERGYGKIIYDDLTQAAFAFQVSRDILARTLMERGRRLIISASPTGKVSLTVETVGKPDLERDLWDEVLTSLARGRSDTRKKKEIYESLFLACKQIGEAEGLHLGELPITQDTPQTLVKLIKFAQEGGSVGKESTELVDLEVLASIVFATLPPGTQKELQSDGRSPDFMGDQDY